MTTGGRKSVRGAGLLAASAVAVVLSGFAAAWLAPAAPVEAAGEGKANVQDISITKANVQDISIT